MDSVLCDSSFIYALYHRDARYHTRAYVFSQGSGLVSIVPDVVFPEVTFLFSRSGGVPAVARFLDQFVGAQSSLECLTFDDLRRARQIMIRYRDANLDFVDCCIAAQAERLNVTRICTFDRRDFPIVRPAHTDYFELLP